MRNSVNSGVSSRTTDETVCAVVATYNRKKDLVSNLDELTGATGLDAVVVVDGYSTDGTGDHLRREGYIEADPPTHGDGHWETTNYLESDDVTFVYRRHFEDFGGAGSFHHGIQRAFEAEYDWFWLLDDDVLVEEASLERMLERLPPLRARGIEPGFLCSKVTWRGREVHKMNVPEVEPLPSGTPFNELDDHGVFRVVSCSFVSALVNREAVAEVGLPLREFFIYNDDVEFTRRITSSGFPGYYTPTSRVSHETADNSGVNIYTDGSTMKHYYSTRNSLYLAKKNSVVKYLLLLAVYLFVRSVRIVSRREEDRVAFLRANVRGVVDSTTFAPEVVYPESADRE